MADNEAVATEEAVEGPKPAPEDYAAHDFMKLIPEFDKKIEELSNWQLKQVFSTIMRYPFDTMTIPKWSYIQQQELFNIAMKLQDARFVLMKAVLEMKKPEIDKLREELETKKEEEEKT
jgi:hypothetical protein